LQVNDTLSRIFRQIKFSKREELFVTTLTIQTPDDWHLHFRDGDMLKETVAATARCFHRAVVMPNLVPPITTNVFSPPARQAAISSRS
jgi:dihydroorotase